MVLHLGEYDGLEVIIDDSLDLSYLDSSPFEIDNPEYADVGEEDLGSVNDNISLDLTPNDDLLEHSSDPFGTLTDEFQGVDFAKVAYKDDFESNFGAPQSINSFNSESLDYTDLGLSSILEKLDQDEQVFVAINPDTLPIDNFGSTVEVLDIKFSDGYVLVLRDSQGQTVEVPWQPGLLAKDTPLSIQQHPEPIFASYSDPSTGRVYVNGYWKGYVDKGNTFYLSAEKVVGYWSCATKHAYSANKEDLGYAATLEDAAQKVFGC